MANLNQCNFIGNLTKEVDLRYTPSGVAVANFSIAVNETWKDRDGQKQERTEFVNIVAWKNLAEICAKYLSKGSSVFIVGKMQTRSYDDRDGNKRYMTEIVANDMQMLGGKGERKENNNQGQQGNSGQQEPPFNPDDDIPF